MAAYRVFISHKEEDKETAIAVRDALAHFSGHLKFFISGEDIQEGTEWKHALRERLRVSDLLLMLFTEPTWKWDWCLYEVGLFTKLDEAGIPVEPVVCIHDPKGAPPSPLLTTQGVRATEADVARFVERLIKTTEITGWEEPLNSNITDQHIRQAAVTISNRFVGNIHHYYACHRVFLELPVTAGDCEAIPPDARITGGEATMRVFGRVPSTETWGELVHSHAVKRAAWLDEINRVFRDACAGRVSAPTTATFRASDGARIFRPELYRLDKKRRTPVAAVIMFTEEVAPAKVGGPVFNRLRIAERYKTEVFDRFEAAPEPLTDASVRELMESFGMIRNEARTQKVYEDETLRRCFPDENMRRDLRSIFKQWDDHSYRLRTAKEANDKDSMGAALRRLDRLNDRYRAIVASRYAELLHAGGECEPLDSAA